MQENRTIHRLIKDVANSKTTTTEEGDIIAYLFRKIGFPNAMVTCGILYINPPNDPPVSVQCGANTLLKTIEQQAEV